MARSQMTSMERVMAVCHNEKPDRVPFILASRAFGLKYAGAKFVQAYEDPDLYVQSQLKLIKDFRLDSVWDIWCTPAVDEALGATMDTPEDDPPWIAQPCVHGPDDLGKLRRVDPWKDGRMPYLLDIVTRLKKAVGDDIPVTAWASPPFRTACMIRGNTELYMDMYDDPRFVKDLLEIATENCTAYGKALVEAGADIIAISNPVANTDCISLEHFKEFAHPYSKHMFGEMKKAGAKAINFHTCGRWDDRFDLCCENVDIIHCDRVNIGEFTTGYGDRVVAMGNVKSVATMLQGSVEQVKREALDCLETAAATGRYILSADCEVPRETSAANVRALADTLAAFNERTFGA
ncbi:MAG: uroporphyrinogen decarboxylase family protein [Hyphomicrobiaceae bacterium]|nr:uroporphyrinogen decarboxylase family protein [Hyphomicrobiaceae bacterium]